MPNSNLPSSTLEESLYLPMRCWPSEPLGCFLEAYLFLAVLVFVAACRLSLAAASGVYTPH